MKLTYNGKHANVAVVLPSGRTVNAARGDSIDFSAQDSKALLQLPGWNREPSIAISEETQS